MAMKVFNVIKEKVETIRSFHGMIALLVVALFMVIVFSQASTLIDTSVEYTYDQRMVLAAVLVVLYSYLRFSDLVFVKLAIVWKIPDYRLDTLFRQAAGTPDKGPTSGSDQKIQ
jgi:hypothetical protein